MEFPMKNYLISAVLCAAGVSAWAADPVTDAMQAAYVPYRVALFRTNSNAQPESQQAIAQAQQAWTKLTEQYSAKPPAPYDRDAAFSASLAEVTKVYAVAAQEITGNQLTKAHETLETARDIMAEMRRRNQVVVFSDHMNAYHSEMEEVLINGPKILAHPNGMQQLTAMVGALNYLAKRLITEAPANYASNAEFSESAKAVNKSVTDLQDALFSQDAAAVKAALAKVKAPYSKFFLKFG
jgi:hypothetical protein